MNKKAMRAQRLDKKDFRETIRAAKVALEKGFLLVDKAQGLVVVKKDNVCDILIQASPAGQATPAQKLEVDSAFYQFYMVSKTLFARLQAHR